MNTSWQITAQQIVSKTLKKGAIGEDDHLAIIAAKALFADFESRPHPSYSNTMFAIAAFMPRSMTENMMQHLAFHLLVNGVSGYFQWVSHNGGKFSVANALVHSEVLTTDEMHNLKQFELYCTHEQCNYFVMLDDFLARITKKWNLPISKPEIGGKRGEKSNQEVKLLKNLKRFYPNCVSSEGKMRIEAALSAL